jgi:hypothetical protein
MNVVKQDETYWETESQLEVTNRNPVTGWTVFPETAYPRMTLQTKRSEVSFFLIFFAPSRQTLRQNFTKLGHDGFFQNPFQLATIKHYTAWATHNPNHTVIWRLKDGTVEPEKAFVARQRFCKHVQAAKNKQPSSYCWPIMTKTVFSVGSAPRVYNEDPRPAEIMIKGVPWDGSRRWLSRDGKKGIRMWKRRLHVCCNDSDTVIYPSPGYD